MAIAIAGLSLVLAAMALVLIGLVIVGTHREAPWTGLDAAAPTPLAAFARSVLGVHVRKPDNDHTRGDDLQVVRSDHRESVALVRPEGR
ncbi:hypothetical protein [Actinoallomurus rhizosphaericola]|uniref:hypothetical protein n=1 Tax=Actinoallomurus rhizosphaericola TaxID=2952536 RepID=UPI002092BCAA|nr:hypothetical protein [Actinoallomurus rhizosphaericola]MCO5995778.1 hypothetical protein [Actinoallomurus rhizosphaericola]